MSEFIRHKEIIMFPDGRMDTKILLLMWDFQKRHWP